MIVTFTLKAEADLEEIGDFIARDNPVRAKTFVDELSRSCLCLADNPSAFPLMPQRQDSGIRRRVHGSYLIFFLVVGERIDILRILHGARDYEAILFPSD